MAAESFNTSDFNGSLTFSNSNRTVTRGATSPGTEAQVRSLTARSSGKVYFEVDATLRGSSTSVNSAFGIASASHVLNGTNYVGNDTTSFGFWPGSSSGNGYYLNNVQTAVNLTAVTGNVWGVAIDFDNKLFWVRNVSTGSNWNNNGSANPATGAGGQSFSSLTGGPWFIIFDLEQTSDAYTLNAGAAAYAGTAPSGFGEWIVAGSVGELAAVDGADIGAAEGRVLVEGSLAATDGPDGATASGHVAVSGLFAGVDGADAASASGQVVVSGDTEGTEGADAAEFAGKVLVAGALAAADGADTAESSGRVEVRGALDATDGADGSEQTGAVIVSGILVATDGADSAEIVGGSPSNVVTGAFAAVDGPDTAAASGIAVQPDSPPSADGVFFGGYGAPPRQPYIPPPQPEAEPLYGFSLTSQRQSAEAVGRVEVTAASRSASVAANLESDGELAVSSRSLSGQPTQTNVVGLRLKMVGSGQTSQTPRSGGAAVGLLHIKAISVSGGEQPPIPRYDGEVAPGSWDEMDDYQGRAA